MNIREAMAELESQLSRLRRAGVTVSGHVWFSAAGEKPVRVAVLPSVRPGAGDAVAPVPAPELPTMAAPALNRETAKSLGYTGELCTMCGSARVVASGACGKCEDCGSSTGCS